MMMKLQRQIRPILGLAAALGLAACGGGSSDGGSSNGPGNNPPPADPVGVTSIGSITGFGSVFVNGTRYEVTANTIVAIEDEAETMGDDSALRVGMKVRVRAIDSSSVRTASLIEYDEDLKGPIESITPDGNDPTIGTISVMSQTVTVDAKTAFDDDVGNNDGIAGIDLRDLQLGMVVEVSGFPNGDGYLATRIDRELDAFGNDPSIGDPLVDDDELEIKAYVDNVAGDLSSITVGGVVFQVGPNVIYEDGLVLNEDLVGAFVEAKADIVGGDYVLVRLEREDRFDGDDRDGEFEIEGVLEAVDTGSTPNTFTINGMTIPVTNAAPLEALVDMHVEIKGRFDANGVLVLREAHEEEEDNVRTEDLVATTDTDAPSFTTRLGLVIQPTGLSRVRDAAAEGDGDHLTPTEFVGRLQPGDRIEARGFGDGASNVVWTGVEREELTANNDDFECELRGPVESFTGNASAFSFVIQGVTIETGRVQEDDFKDENELPIGRALFWDRLQSLPVVEAESFEGDAFCMTGMLDARQLEIEGPDGS
jgi:hypothetical protein